MIIFPGGLTASKFMSLFGALRWVTRLADTGRALGDDPLNINKASRDGKAWALIQKPLIYWQLSLWEK
jgi:hypothetical protein